MALIQRLYTWSASYRIGTAMMIPRKRYVATFELVSLSPTTTDVYLTHEGEHDDIQKDISDWADYYFEPIKKLLEA